MKQKVSDYLADFLAEKEVRHVFGIIGSGNSHIWDSISRRGYSEIVCVHHEQAAVMAMGIYYRMTGKISASILTTGAGSANGVTGVVSNWMDSVPGLILSGNENSRFTTPENPLRIWGIQGFDSTAMVQKVTKYASRVMDPSLIRAELEKAFDIAGRDRPGPVWIDVPMNIQAAPIEDTDLKTYRAPAREFFKPTASAPDISGAVKQVVELLGRAERPVLWLGHGIRLAGALQLIEPLLEKTGTAALVSWTGIDMIDSEHPQVFGRAGIYGQRAANFVLQNSDFVLALGTRLSVPQVGYDLAELARAAKIAVVDIDPTEVSKHGARISLPICADARLFMSALLESLPGAAPASRTTWLEQCRKYRAKYPPVGPEHADKDGYINSYPFMDKLSKLLKPDQVIVTDMGTALLSGHQVLSLKPGQRLMTSQGLGEMGFGISAALGASFARDRGEVLCLNCDGGMMMNLQELQTIAHHQLPIKIVVFNNDGYLMIKHTQNALFQGRHYGVDVKTGVSCPDFGKLAAAFGFAQYQIRTWEDFDSMMPQVLAEKGPTICEVFTHPNQLLVPKLGLAPQKDGSIISPPLEDLSPFLSREEIREAMIIGMHPKSEAMRK